MNTTNFGNIECVAVYTCRGRDRILSEGGSQAWRIDMSKASKHKFLVCIQNRNQTWGQPTAEHKTAFLIGKISSIEKSTEEDAEGRAIIKISEFAELNVPDSWDGNRNPVAYTTLSEYGIHSEDDYINLNWARLGTNFHFNFDGLEPQKTKMLGDDYEAVMADEQLSSVNNVAMPLSIEEAKQGLALKFGVRVNQIDITIRG